jgi:hypothetical protein
VAPSRRDSLLPLFNPRNRWTEHFRLDRWGTARRHGTARIGRVTVEALALNRALFRCAARAYWSVSAGWHPPGGTDAGFWRLAPSVRGCEAIVAVCDVLRPALIGGVVANQPSSGSAPDAISTRSVVVGSRLCNQGLMVKTPRRSTTGWELIGSSPYWSTRKR